MKILGIIPARGNSKRLPDKNLADLGGKSLVQRALDVAIESKIFEEGWLWVSSEDDRIGEIAGPYWWRRDPSLSRDTTPSLDVILDVYGHQPADITILLQPTSPFRTSEDIKNSLDLFLLHNADVLISTIEGPRDAIFLAGHAGRLRLIPDIEQPNGAIYIIRNKILDQGLDWYDGPAVYHYKMPKERSIDIDTQFELDYARFLLNAKDQRDCRDN